MSTHTEDRTTFHTAQVDTRGDGLALPPGAVIDSAEHVSQGEYVNVTYHVTREVEIEDAPNESD
jgi:hypothetical protein